MRQQEEEQTLELPPLMTNKRTYTHAAELQKQPPFQSLSHEAGQKERDILWLWTRGSDSRCLSLVCVCASRSLESVLLSITCILVSFKYTNTLKLQWEEEVDSQIYAVYHYEKKTGNSETEKGVSISSRVAILFDTL